MPIMVDREKWILYKHTSDYDLVKAVARDVKENCATKIGETERYLMQERLAAESMYKLRNIKKRPLDSINHRINTLEFYMFGYEYREKKNKRFIFSPLGNLFLKHIDDEEKLQKIFIAMLFGVQFPHWANGTPDSFQIYPFRLLLQLMSDNRLDNRLYSTEYAYIIAFIREISKDSYEDLVDRILSFRRNSDDKIAKMLKNDEHTYVNCIYEWQYYTQKLLKSIGILKVHEGEKICKLYHPQKPNSKSNPTGRWVKNGYAEISAALVDFVEKMLRSYSYDEKPLKLDSGMDMQIDVVKEIYSFYPDVLLKEIGEDADDISSKLLQLSKLIEKYSNNPDNKAAYLFEDVLTEGFNMFMNVEARKIGGAGSTDIECLYFPENLKFAVEAKSTANKLIGINAGRLREHRRKIGGKYTIVITPRYVPAAKKDIKNEPIVVVLASTFSEYLYNHIYHDIREIDYGDFHQIITHHLGSDVSKLISDMTMNKFAAKS